MNPSQHTECYVEVQADITRLEADLEELRAVAKWHQSKAAPKTSEPPVENDCPRALSRSRGHTTGPYTNMKQIRAAEEVLRVAEEPLNTKVIAQKLLEGGFVAKNIKRLVASLFTGMTRKPDIFIKTGPGTWALKEAEL